jgi:hypothetical protein
LYREVILSEREAHLAFLVLYNYIREVHPTILPRIFDIHFKKRHYSEIHVIRELARERIPKKAPEKYQGKWRATETVPDFFRRVWGKYLRAGLTMPLLKDRDVRLYHAILNYRRIHGWPAELELPNREVELRAAVEIFYRKGPDALTADQHVAVAQFLKRQESKAANRPRTRGGKRRTSVDHNIG